MKKCFFLIFIVTALLAACNQVEVIGPDLSEIEGWEDFQSNGSGSLDPGHIHNLLLVKFRDNDFKNYVCVGHRMVQRGSGEDIPYIYEEDTLGLACGYYQWPYPSCTFPSDSVARFAEEILSLCGSSPYLELADGYYLIDWKWYGIARPWGLMAKHVAKHCFLSDTMWENLSSLSSTWSRREVTKNPFAEIVGIRLLHLDLYRGCYPDSRWYNNQPSVLHAYLSYYYPNGDVFYPEHNRTYEDYVQYCDSMYSVYQQCLSDIIKNDDLHQIAIRYLYE